MQLVFLFRTHRLLSVNCSSSGFTYLYEFYFILFCLKQFYIKYVRSQTWTTMTILLVAFTNHETLTKSTSARCPWRLAEKGSLKSFISKVKLFQVSISSLNIKIFITHLRVMAKRWCVDVSDTIPQLAWVCSGHEPMSNFKGMCY